VTDRPLICHVIYQLAVGGLENGLVNLVNGLPDDAYRHAILCVTAATDFRRRIARPDVAIREIGKRPGKDVAAYGRLWRILREMRPRIVHTRNLPALDMLFPAWLAGVPRLVHSEHGLDMRELDGRNPRYNRLRRLSRAVVDRYVTVSRDLNDWLADEIGVRRDRLELIYNGVDTDRFAPGARKPDFLPPGFLPEGGIVFGTIGRFEAVKHQLGLVNAFIHLLAERPALRRSLRLVIVGEGSQRPEIEKALAEGNATELAWLPGLRDDTPDFYRAFDVFVLPSLREGISNTILEAMACGRAVLATRVGGNAEILPEEGGRLVPAEDPAAMAAALGTYAEAPALFRAQGEAGRRHALKNFSLAAMLGAYDRVYRSLL
jgi:sugar transferase (PEP-CTERM/EpsH1 system associated)